MKDAAQKITRFTDIKAWQASRELVKNIYKIVGLFPVNEQYGLTSQMKRAAVSISSNIAEGFRRDTMKDKLHFYVMAHGSLTELQCQIILAHDLFFIHKAEFSNLATLTDETDRLLTGLIKASKERL